VQTKKSFCKVKYVNLIFVRGWSENIRDDVFLCSDTCEIPGIVNLVEAMWTLYSSHRGASTAFAQKSVARLLM
jgi:hypothetical protein